MLIDAGDEGLSEHRRGNDDEDRSTEVLHEHEEGEADGNLVGWECVLDCYGGLVDQF